MSLEPGNELGPYRIAGSLGAAGVDEVYRAPDGKTFVGGLTTRSEASRELHVVLNWLAELRERVPVE